MTGNDRLSRLNMLLQIYIYVLINIILPFTVLKLYTVSFKYLNYFFRLLMTVVLRKVFSTRLLTQFYSGLQPFKSYSKETLSLQKIYVNYLRRTMASTSVEELTKKAQNMVR